MYGFKIMIEGEYACFTRPEFKADRVSYDVPTPSALEGLLKSIYWNPSMRYEISKIIVFNPISFINIKSNEVKEKIKLSAVKKKMNDPDYDLSLYTSESRTQRSSMILRDVRYGVEFHFEMTGIKSNRENDQPGKHYNIIRRRIEKGQHFKTPCLGRNEFPVKRIYLVDEFPLQEMSEEIRHQDDRDFGYMLYKLKFKDGGLPINNDWENPKFSDKAIAVYYRPHMKNGIIDISEYKEDDTC